MSDEKIILEALVSGRQAFVDLLRQELDSKATAMTIKREELARAQKGAEAIQEQISAMEGEVGTLREHVASWNQQKAQREEAARRFPNLAPAVAAVDQALLEAQMLLARKQEGVEKLRHEIEHVETLKQELASMQADQEALAVLLRNEDPLSPQEGVPSTPDLALQARQQIQELQAHFSSRKNADTSHMPPETTPGQPERLVRPSRSVLDHLQLQVQAIDWYLVASTTKNTNKSRFDREKLAQKARSLGCRAWALTQDANRLKPPALTLFREWYQVAFDAFVVVDAVRADESLRSLLRGSLQLVAHAVSALKTLSQRSAVRDETIQGAFDELSRMTKVDLVGGLRYMTYKDPAEPSQDLDSARSALRELQARMRDRPAVPVAKAARQQKNPAKKSEDVPATAMHAIEMARKNFADTLVFGDDVSDGASRLHTNTGSPSKILSCLEALAVASRALQDNTLGRSLKDWLRHNYGLHVSDESTKVKNNRRETKERTWHDGQKARVFRMHVRLNECAGSDDCVRIYFAWDRDRQRILVGWVGKYP